MRLIRHWQSKLTPADGHTEAPVRILENRVRALADLNHGKVWLYNVPSESSGGRGNVTVHALIVFRGPLRLFGDNGFNDALLDALHKLPYSALLSLAPVDFQTQNNLLATAILALHLRTASPERSQLWKEWQNCLSGGPPRPVVPFVRPPAPLAVPQAPAQMPVVMPARPLAPPAVPLAPPQLPVVMPAKPLAVPLAPPQMPAKPLLAVPPSEEWRDTSRLPSPPESPGRNPRPRAATPPPVTGRLAMLVHEAWRGDGDLRPGTEPYKAVLEEIFLDPPRWIIDVLDQKNRIIGPGTPIHAIGEATLENSLIGCLTTLANAADLIAEHIFQATARFRDLLQNMDVFGELHKNVCVALQVVTGVLPVIRAFRAIDREATQEYGIGCKRQGAGIAAGPSKTRRRIVRSQEPPRLVAAMGDENKLKHVYRLLQLAHDETHNGITPEESLHPDWERIACGMQELKGILEAAALACKHLEVELK